MTIAVSGCAHQDPWTTRDTVGQVLYTAVLAADAMTTAQIQHTPGVYENGPIAQHVLGRQPATKDTYMFFTTVAISNYFITRALPAKWRPYWQGSNIIYHGYWVERNCDLGLC